MAITGTILNNKISGSIQYSQVGASIIVPVASWGNITGSISGQTDLNIVLQDKVSTSIFNAYTGTTHGITNASNGITLNGQTVKLGGVLTENTTINLGINPLILQGASSNYIFSDSYLNFTSGVASVLIDGMSEFVNIIIGGSGIYVSTDMAALQSSQSWISATANCVDIGAEKVMLVNTPADGTSTDSVLTWNPDTKEINKLPYQSYWTGTTEQYDLVEKNNLTVYYVV